MDRSIETSPYMTGFTRHGISPQNHLEFQQFQHAQTRCGLRNHGTKFGVAMWSNECKNAERIITCFMAGPARRVIPVVNTPGIVLYVPYRTQPWKIVRRYFCTPGIIRFLSSNGRRHAGSRQPCLLAFVVALSSADTCFDALCRAYCCLLYTSPSPRD